MFKVMLIYQPFPFQLSFQLSLYYNWKMNIILIYLSSKLLSGKSL